MYDTMYELYHGLTVSLYLRRPSLYLSVQRSDTVEQFQILLASVLVDNADIQ
jgi:hypothetical protein